MGTKQVNMHEAKSTLSELGELAWRGETIVIAKAGKPYLDLQPHLSNRKARQPGRFKDLIKISDDFDKPPETLIKTIEER